MNGEYEAEATYARAYGGLLLACAMLTVLGVVGHPTLVANDASSLLEGLAGQRGPIVGLHSILIALGLLQVVGFYGFSRLLGPARPLVAAGLILFGFGVLGLINAAVLNGFAAPAFAAMLEGASAAEAEMAAVALKLNWSHNQAWDGIGSMAWCGAILCWSLAMLRRRGLPRLVGLLGLAAALAIGGAIAGGLVRFNVGGFMATVAALAAWSIAVALLMLTGRMEIPMASTGDA
jgi:hypothetical protein